MDRIAAKAVAEARPLLSERFQSFLKLGLAKTLDCSSELSPESRARRLIL